MREYFLCSMWRFDRTRKSHQYNEIYRYFWQTSQMHWTCFDHWSYSIGVLPWWFYSKRVDFLAVFAVKLFLWGSINFQCHLKKLLLTAIASAGLSLKEQHLIAGVNWVCFFKYSRQFFLKSPFKNKFNYAFHPPKWKKFARSGFLFLFFLYLNCPPNRQRSSENLKYKSRLRLER